MSVDEDQLAVVDVETCLILLLFNVRVLNPHHINNRLFQLLHICSTAVSVCVAKYIFWSFIYSLFHGAEEHYSSLIGDRSAPGEGCCRVLCCRQLSQAPHSILHTLQAGGEVW